MHKKEKHVPQVRRKSNDEGDFHNPRQKHNLLVDLVQREIVTIECSQKEFQLELARRAEGVHSAHEVVKNLRWVRSDAELEVT